MKKVTKVFLIISALLLVAAVVMFSLQYKGDIINKAQDFLADALNYYYISKNKKVFYIIIGSLALFSAFVGIFMARSRRKGLSQTRSKLWLILAIECALGCLLFLGHKGQVSVDKITDKLTNNFAIHLRYFKNFKLLALGLFGLQLLTLFIAALIPGKKKEAKKMAYKPLRARFYLISVVVIALFIFYVVFSHGGSAEAGYLIRKTVAYTLRFNKDWVSPHMQAVMIGEAIFIFLFVILISLARRKRNVLPVIYLYAGLIIAYQLFIFKDTNTITAYLYTNVLDEFSTKLTTISLSLLLIDFVIFVTMVGYSFSETIYSLFDKNETTSSYITKNQVTGIQNLLDSIENPVDEVDETPDEEEEEEKEENKEPQEESVEEQTEEKVEDSENTLDEDDDPDAYDDEEDDDEDEEEESEDEDETDEDEELDEDDEDDDAREALKRRRELIRQRILAAKAQSEEEEEDEDEVVVEDEDQVVYEDDEDEVVTQEEPIDEEAEDDEEEEISDVYEESVKYDDEDEELEDDDEEESEDDDDEEEVEDEVIVSSDSTDAQPSRKFVRVPTKPLKEKLLLLDDEKKERYNTIRNELQSYKKVHERLSSKGDSYRFHGDLIAKMSIAGKTVRLHLALNPKDFENSKYAIRDLSDKKRYVYTPLTLRLTSKRSVKHAKELIEMLASAFNLEKNPKYQEQDYISQIEIEEKTKGE